MFDKQVVVHLKPTDVEILNNDELIKTASFVLPNDTKYDPDFTYLLVRAVSAGEYYDDNKNGDFFPEEELKKYYTTFLKAHVFKNHENKDVMNAIGDVLNATWLDKMKQVELLIKVDRRIAPSVVRGIEKGYITDVSMGCRVKYSICSICGNKARTQREYCEHIKLMRRQIFPDGRKVYEINIGPSFHDISIVLNGAEKVAKIEGVYEHNEKLAEKSSLSMMEKVASVQNQKIPQKQRDFSEVINSSREVLASVQDYSHMSKQEYLQKVAEIEKQIEGEILNSSLDDIVIDRMEKAQNVRNVLRCFYTEVLSSSDIKTICAKLVKIAKINKRNIYDTFDQFLKVLDFAGIELTPYELKEIIKILVPDILRFNSSIKGTSDDLSSATRADEICLKSDCSGMNLRTSLPALKIVFKKVLNGETLGGQNLLNAMRIAGKSSCDNSADLMQNDIMNKVVQEIMPRKSMFPKFVIARIRVKPKHIVNPFISFTNGVGAQDIFSNLLYRIYQGDRMERLASGETERGMQKFAHYYSDKKQDLESSLSSFNKTAAPNFEYLDYTKKNSLPQQGAYNTATAIAFGYPIINILSKYQRAKIANGNRASNFGRMIADYPADVHQFQSLFGPTLYAIAKSKAIQTGTGITNSIAGLFNGSYSKYGPTPMMLKSASERDNADKKERIIKLALNLMMQKRDDAAEKILKNLNISKKDLNLYLQSRKKCYTIDLNDKIEKCASDICESNSLLPSGFCDAIEFAALVDFVIDNTN